LMSPPCQPSIDGPRGVSALRRKMAAYQRPTETAAQGTQATISEQVPEFPGLQLILKRNSPGKAESAIPDQRLRVGLWPGLCREQQSSGWHHAIFTLHLAWRSAISYRHSCRTGQGADCQRPTESPHPVSARRWRPASMRTDVMRTAIRQRDSIGNVCSAQLRARSRRAST